MIAMTWLGWYAFGAVSALVPSVVVVLILFLHARRFPPVRESSEPDSVGLSQTWQCEDCLNLWVEHVVRCPLCSGTNLRLVPGPWSKRHLEPHAPNKQRKAAGSRNVGSAIADHD